MPYWDPQAEASLREYNIPMNKAFLFIDYPIYVHRHWLIICSVLSDLVLGAVGNVELNYVMILW